MITKNEKIKAIEERKGLAEQIIYNPYGKIYYKALSNFILKTSSTNKFELNTAILNNVEMIDNLSEILKYIIIESTEDNSSKKYTTGQLAKFFGVSITSINNWINKGRFVGIERKTSNKQIKISENVMWKSSNGEQISIKDVVKMWEEDKKSCNNEKKLEDLTNEIKFFENKYNGTYEKTLKLKQDLTESEKIDKEEWEYLLQRRSK